MTSKREPFKQWHWDANHPGMVEHPNGDYVLVSDVASAIEALEAERDEAQSMVQAWDHVFGTIEAHIMDRVNMRDEAKPATYLEIIRSDIACIKRASDQICAARWADYKRHADAVAASEARCKRLEEALRDIITQDDDYRSSMSPEVEKDPVTLACERARLALQENTNGG